MLAIPLLSPYILIPLLMTWLFRKYRVKPMWLTFLLTAMLLLVYPDLMTYFLFLFKEPLKENRSGCMFPPIFVNIPLLPLAMIFQAISNRTMFSAR